MMLFNSWTFAAFFAMIFCAYWVLRRDFRRQNLLLLAGSMFFYGFWDWRFLFLLAAMIAAVYLAARQLAVSGSRRRFWLTAGLVVLLSNLAFFKYCGFFAESLIRVLNWCGFRADPFTLQLVLPVGISFYTFIMIAYLVDVYRGKIVPERNFCTFALFCSYFPQILAGPIARADDLLVRLNSPRDPNMRTALYRAMPLILSGFLKKTVIADMLAVYTDQSFSAPGGNGFPVLWVSMYLYTLQIYGDFSGYTDMARGFSRLLGIELAVNFRQPYFSGSISEFWRRWHISLSSWLRDYLYIPLGGSRKGKLRTYCNSMVTMLLGGLWHGAGWNFVLWGGLHGLFLTIHKMFLGDRKVDAVDFAAMKRSPFRCLGGILLTFHAVAFAWIFFRCASWDSVAAFFSAATVWECDRARLLKGLVYLVFYGALTLAVDVNGFVTGSEEPVPERFPAWLRGLCYALLVMFILKFGGGDAMPFIYFQF